MSNQCPSCDRITDEDLCPDCGVLTGPIEDGNRATDRAGGGDDGSGAEPAAAAAPPPPKAPPPKAPTPKAPTPAPETPPPPPPRASPQAGIPQAGQQQLAQYVEDGYEIFLIAGIAGTGKTQMLDAYRRDPYLSTFVKKKGLVMPTAKDILDCHPVKVGRRKVVFVDTSGEHFKDLYPFSRDDEISESSVDFLRLVSGRLGGLVLLVDLARLWQPAVRTNPEDEAQVRILTWILVLLRWLQEGGEHEGGSIRFQDDVNRRVMRLNRRLKVPVLALFSKADELASLPVPERRDRAWLGRKSVSRTLLPVGEDPLLVAHHCVPELLEALVAHADHFRVDFAHSLVTDPDAGDVVDPEPCGVALSLQWLLDWSWQRRWRWLPAIPARSWIAVQRVLDTALQRGGRWRRLPNPVDVAR